MNYFYFYLLPQPKCINPRLEEMAVIKSLSRRGEFSVSIIKNADFFICLSAS